MPEYRKPLPVTTWEETKEFWEGCKNHELLIQKCMDCGTYRWYPRPMCHRCNSMNVGWIKVSGKATVYSWTVVSHPTGAVWTDEVPYIVVVAELDEGVRMLSNMVDCEPDALSVGMPLEVVFDDINDRVTLPKFRPAS